MHGVALWLVLNLTFSPIPLSWNCLHPVFSTRCEELSLWKSLVLHSHTSCPSCSLKTTGATDPLCFSTRCVCWNSQCSHVSWLTEWVWHFVQIRLRCAQWLRRTTVTVLRHLTLSASALHLFSILAINIILQHWFGGVTESSFCYSLMPEASGDIFSLALYSSN